MAEDTLDSLLSGGGNEPEIEQQEVAADTGGESQQEQQIEAEGEGGTQGQKTVPHEALHAEKQKVKRYTEEVSEFRRSNEALQRQVTELLQRVPIPKQEVAAKPDWFENPETATQNAVQTTVGPQFDQVNQTLLAFAKDMAINRFDEAAVNTAEQEFIKALQSKTLDPADYQKVVSSPNRYAAAVQWHKQQQARAEIGDDPAAFRAKLEAEILAKHGLTAEGAAAEVPAKPPVLPSNLAGARNVGSRSGPAWSGPPSLQDIFDTTRPN